MTEEETYELTAAMCASGERLEWDLQGRPTADKHSTGGVGDKISVVLAPLAAEIGMAVPMLSGRGLGHTGGTLDKLESIPGYRIDLSTDEMKAQLDVVGCFISGQTARLAPADRRLYHLRDVTATVDCVPLIVSSIMSKKLAAGPRHLVIDLKCGSGAFMRSLDDARILARALVGTGRRAGRAMSTIVTDMDQPLGRAVGHALEVAESVECLQGGGPPEVRELSLELVAEMGALAGLGSRAELRGRSERALDAGSAYERFVAMVRAQGGRLEADRLDIAPVACALLAERDGWLAGTDAAAIGIALSEIRAARVKQDDRLDLSGGIEMLVRIGDRIERGQEIARIRTRDGEGAEACRQRLARALVVSEEEVQARPLVLERLG
jgi:pyrimidine-nucleoside phosphorylase